MKIVVSLNILPNYISLLIVGSLKSVIFIALPFFFSAVHKHRLQEYSKCQAYQTLFKITHRYKTINKK